MMSTYPAYMENYRSGELSRRVEKACQSLASCTLCPRVCRKNRFAGEVGDCGIGRHALISSYGPHHGEEHVLRGCLGSGTIFFAGCNLRCMYCQNYDISQLRAGRPVSPERLAALFLEIQDLGCHNLNLVTPSHIVAQFLEALLTAVERGFRLPVVYNTSSYDAIPALRLLDGIIDIYMPDIKYSDSLIAETYSGIPHYWDVAKKSIREMHRQVGDLEIVDGIARRGVLFRHLVLPNNLAGTERIAKFLAEEISVNSWVNIMDQYHPMFHAREYNELKRRLTVQEYQQAVETALSAGIHRGIPFGD